jgi:hypothetical protein
MRVFIDTEFTSFETPTLISIGPASVHGDELYLELLSQRTHAPISLRAKSSHTWERPLVHRVPSMKQASE